MTTDYLTYRAAARVRNPSADNRGPRRSSHFMPNDYATMNQTVITLHAERLHGYATEPHHTSRLVNARNASCLNACLGNGCLGNDCLGNEWGGGAGDRPVSLAKGS